MCQEEPNGYYFLNLWLISELLQKKKNQLKSFILRKIVVPQSQPPCYIYAVIRGTWSFSTDFSRKQPKSGADYLSGSYKPGDGAYCFIQG